MILFIVLALLNGLLIGLARVFNGRLAASKGAFKASWANHIVGFLAITLIILFSQPLTIAYHEFSPLLLTGGIIGALYVGVNSFVVSRLGVTNTTVLVISGQLSVSVLIDRFSGRVSFALDWDTLQLFIGLVLLLVGFIYSVKNRK